MKVYIPISESNKGKDNIINVRLSEDYGEWSYVTKKVEWEIYVYASDRGDAINKAHKIFKKEMKCEKFPLF